MVRNTLPRRFGVPGLPELNASQVIIGCQLMKFMKNVCRNCLHGIFRIVLILCALLTQCVISVIYKTDL